MIGTDLPYLLLVLVCALMLGCGPHGAAIPTRAGASAIATDPARVLLFASGRPAYEFTIVGFVVADGADSNEALGELRERAASLGANGVVALEVDLHGASRVMARGTAVVFV